MTSIQIDRLDGLSSATAIKGPCLAATTVNITLYGEQTIDGIAVVSGNRVLVKNQTAAYENGIYVCDTGQWRRAKDFNRTNDVVEGTQVLVTDGNTYERSLWCVISANPIVVGTNSVSFAQTIVSAAEIEAAQAAAEAAAATAEAAAEAASHYADLARNNWVASGPFTGTGTEADYLLSADPATANNMFVIVGGVDQLITQNAYALVYSGGNPYIRIAVPTGVPFEVRTSNAVNVNTPADGSVSTPKIAAGAVVTAKIADDNVTYAKMQNISATLRLLGRKTAGAGDAEEISAAELRDLFLPSGSVVDSAPATPYVANASFTGAGAVIPLDDTIPQISEGVQILTATLTPKSITNKFRIRTRGGGACDTSTVWSVAVFNGAANAIASATVYNGDAQQRALFALEFEYTPGVLTAQTITVRVGTSNSGHTIRMNGTTVGRELGGSQACTLIIEEIKG